TVVVCVELPVARAAFDTALEPPAPLTAPDEGSVPALAAAVPALVSAAVLFAASVALAAPLFDATPWVCSAPLAARISARSTAEPQAVLTSAKTAHDTTNAPRGRNVRSLIPADLR